MAVIERNIFDELFVLEVANIHWGSSDHRRTLARKEIEYLAAPLRGVYARRDLPAGACVTRSAAD